MSSLSHGERSGRSNTLAGFTGMPSSLGTDRTRTDGWHRVNVPDSQREATKIINNTKEMEHGTPTSLDLAGLQLRELPLETFTVHSLVSLNAGDNEMTTVPRAMENLTNLRQLRMPHNRFKSIPTCIFSMVNLTKIALSGNEIVSVPSDISSLQQLKTLQLANNQLTELPAEIVHLSSLEQLDLAGNALSVLPEALLGLDSLARLNLRCNELTEVPDCISQLTSLRILNLRCNNIVHVSPALVSCTALRVLILRYNRIDQLPEDIGNLTDLRELDVYDNRLHDLPSSLGTLNGLTELMIKENPLHPQLLRATRRGAQGILAYVRMQAKSGPSPLERLPSRWGLGSAATGIESTGASKQVDLSATLNPFNQDLLQKLATNAQEVDGMNLSHNNLTSVNPQVVSQFTMLKNLNLCQNSLLNVPSSLGNLKHLTVLDLSGNMLEVLPRTFSQIRSLEVLNLSVNRLCTLPPTFGDLSNLKQVFLFCNNIGFLPANIRQLAKLEVLDLHKNRLTAVPADVGSLSMLTSLNLSYNRLTDLPMELCSLAALKTLDARSNLLRQLPKRLEGLVSLERLDLSTNKLVEVDDLSKLTGLSHCVLDNQDIVSLPDLSHWNAMATLSVASNQLEELPTSVSCLTNLVSLNISHNRMVFPPRGLEHLPLLAELRINHNPWAWNVASRLQRACKFGVNAILQQLEQLSESASTIRMEAKEDRPVASSYDEQYEKRLAYKELGKWNVADVRVWLGCIGLDYLQRKAGQMCLDGPLLMSLSEAELEEALLIRSKLDLEFLRKKIVAEKEKVMSFKKVSVRPTMRSSGGLLRRNRDDSSGGGAGPAFSGMGGARMRKVVEREESPTNSASMTESVRVMSTSDPRLPPSMSPDGHPMVQSDRPASAPATAPTIHPDRARPELRTARLATERAGTRLAMGMGSRSALLPTVAPSADLASSTSPPNVQKATLTEPTQAHKVRVIRMWKVAAPGEEDDVAGPPDNSSSSQSAGWFYVTRPESR